MAKKLVDCTPEERSSHYRLIASTRRIATAPCLAGYPSLQRAAQDLVDDLSSSDSTWTPAQLLAACRVDFLANEAFADLMAKAEQP